MPPAAPGLHAVVVSFERLPRADEREDGRHGKRRHQRLLGAVRVAFRKSNTPLRLTNGNIVFPSSDMKPCIVRTIEVSHNSTAQ